MKVRWLLKGAMIGVVWLVATAAGVDAANDRRIALVIGNSTYKEAPLRNPVNDARAMAASLKARGFEVIIRENASKQQMESAIADFGEKLSEGSTGLFFYAGHGMQLNGRNYLVPVDASIVTEQRVRIESTDVDLVLEQMHAAKSRVNMVILDACRNNPFERRFRAVGGGLAQINAPEGTLIAYSTAPGRVAADGEGRNSLYTEELLRSLGEPGLKVEEVFKSVRVAVARRSGGTQTPWEASSLVGDFYFVAPLPVGPSQAELAFWDRVKMSSSPAELQAYINQFPNGAFVAAARDRIADMTSLRAQDLAHWEKVKDAKGAAPLESYLEKFPNGLYELVAKARIASLKGVAAPPPSLDTMFWESLKDSPDIEDFQIYLKRFPTGAYVAAARQRIAALTPPAAPARPVAAAPVAPAPSPVSAPVAAAPAAQKPAPVISAAAPVTQPAPRQPSPAPTPVSAAPVAVSPPAQPEPAKPVQQQAALPAPPAPAMTTYDGYYQARFRATTGEVEAGLNVNGTRVTGFASAAGSAEVCPIRGSVDAAGSLRHLEMQCSSMSLSFAGQFTKDRTDKAFIAETRASSLNTPTPIAVLWAPPGLLPPEQPPAAIAAVAPRPKVVDAPPVQQAALPPADAPVSGFDGHYTTSFFALGQHGSSDFTAGLTIQGTRIRGYAQTRLLFESICPVRGSITPAGVIERLELDCKYSSFIFSGRFVVDPATGAAVGETKATGVNTRTPFDVRWTREAASATATKQ